MHRGISNTLLCNIYGWMWQNSDNENMHVGISTPPVTKKRSSVANEMYMPQKTQLKLLKSYKHVIGTQYVTRSTVIITHTRSSIHCHLNVSTLYTITLIQNTRGFYDIRMFFFFYIFQICNPSILEGETSHGQRIL